MLFLPQRWLAARDGFFIMAKRFIDSSMWDKDWFLDLPSKYKILWIYMITKCDTAGVFDPNLKTVSKMLNEKYTEDEIFKYFKGLIFKIQDKWILMKFIKTQYGSNISQDMIKPINKCLEKIGHSLDTVITLSLDSAMTPIEIEIEKEIEIKEDRIVKERNQRFTKPTLEQVKEYCQQTNSNIDSEIFWHNYESTGWIKANGQPIINWKSTIKTWERRNKIEQKGGWDNDTRKLKSE